MKGRRWDHLVATLRFPPANRAELEIVVDFAAFGLIVNRRWRAVKKVRSKSYYAVASIDGREVSLHRLIMGNKVGDGTIVRHVNGNGLDCRKTNLRRDDRSRYLAEAWAISRGRKGSPGEKVVWKKLNDGRRKAYVYDRLTGRPKRTWIEHV